MSAPENRRLLHEAGLDEIEPIDVELAALIGGLSTPDTRDILGATALLLSRERRGGHACVDLAAWAGRPRVGHSDGRAAYPDLDAWSAALRASGLVGDGEGATPIVLDDGGRCYLRRYHEAEQRVASWIRAAVAAVPGPVAAHRARADTDDPQARVLEQLATRRLVVLAGGPGSGKTTAIAGVLARLDGLGAGLRVALAAPTGKAAARLGESIGEHAARLEGKGAIGELLASLEAKTLHRLLGFGGRGPGPRYDAAHKLPADIVIVDEASMVDLPLMDALLDALAADAKLVLVGDKDQLASVEAGFVFGDLCEAAREAPGSRVAGAVIELTTSWRFASKPGIETLAAAVRAGNAEDAEAALANPALSDVSRHEMPRDGASLVEALADDLLAMVTAGDPEHALAAFSGLRLLSATHRGPFGVNALNSSVESLLRSHGAIESSGRSGFYAGRPVLVTINDYSLELFNGDVGLCLPDDRGQLRAWFPSRGGRLRSFSPSRLPAHSTAWAMTVHKSQGSEFERVALVLPDGVSPMLTRELVYTAITRARSSVRVFASAPTLATAISTRAARASGLRNAILAG